MAETSILLRQARPDDAAVITKLLEQLGYPNDVQSVRKRIEDLETPDNAVVVAVIDQEVVGMASLHRIPLFHTENFLGRITSFVVDEQFHRTGIGKRLLEYIDTWAKESDCERIEVTSSSHRVDAHTFYQAMGYKFDHGRFIKKSSLSL